MIALPRIPPEVMSKLRAYWRRRWVVLGVAWPLALVGWVGVMLLPDRYECMTRIFADTDNLLTPLLRNITVQSDLEKQLDVIERTLLNHNNLVAVAHSADLDLDAVSEIDKEALYDRLKKRITVRAERRNLFTVSYTDPDPRQAKKVVETLLNIFVETNLGQNRTSMEAARNFIETQIGEYEQKLKQAEQRLATYKSQHTDMVMAIGSGFSARLESARQEAAAAKGRLQDAQVAREQLRAGLASTPQYLEIDNSPQVVVTGGGGPAATAKGRVTQAQTEYDKLRSKYTDLHPDVVAARQALDAAKAEVATEAREDAAKPPGTPERGRVSNPVYEQVKVRAVQADAEVAQAQTRFAIANEELQRLQGLAETAPKIEADLADLNREYGVVKGKYEELLGRRESARISEAAENSDKVQFRVIEAPQLPARPSFPNRPLFLTAVLVMAVGAGGAIVFLLDKLDQTVSSVTILTEDLHVRVLGMVPRVKNAVRAAESRRKLWRFGMAGGSLFVAFGLVLAVSSMVKVSDLLARLPMHDVINKVISRVG